MEKSVISSVEELVAFLAAKGLTVCTAESCTGGMIAAEIVSVSGASSVFPGSLVSYATRVKEEFLGVLETTVEEFTVVSAAVAEEMAKGALRMMKTDLAVSVTGLAGPGGGTEEIPVGSVFIGYATKKAVRVESFIFGGGREQVRRSAAEAALRGALVFAKENFS